MKNKIFIPFLICIFLASCDAKNNSQEDLIINDEYREIFYSFVSSAENSTLDYKEQYSYIEDIGDGRGYTAGIIGFTSGTGDLLLVVHGPGDDEDSFGGIRQAAMDKMITPAKGGDETEYLLYFVASIVVDNVWG